MGNFKNFKVLSWLTPTAIIKCWYDSSLGLGMQEKKSNLPENSVPLQKDIEDSLGFTKTFSELKYLMHKQTCCRGNFLAKLHSVSQNITHFT